MRCPVFSSLLILLVLVGSAGVVRAQQGEPTTRQGAIEQQEAEKVKTLKPYVPNKAEQVSSKIQQILSGETKKFHPFFDSAYPGGGFAVGAGYTTFVSSYNFVDVRGSYSLSNYKRIEAEFVAPRLFHRRGHLSVVGGWRDAPQVKFFGLGTDSPDNNQTSYSYTRPYLSTLLDFWPTRRYLMLRGGVEFTHAQQDSGGGRFPSVETVYTPETLPGLFGDPNYLHTQGTVAFDWRTSPGYTRRGGYYGVTGHVYSDRDNLYGFKQIDYEAIQHFPVLREAWVFSFHALVRTTNEMSGETTPFFMYPYLGGSSSLRGFTSLRFRDQNSMLLQGEWRIMANRYLDSAIFYDAGKVVARRADLDLSGGFRHDIGFGVRFHGPTATPLRLEVAKGNEGFVLVFATGAAF